MLWIARFIIDRGQNSIGTWRFVCYREKKGTKQKRLVISPSLFFIFWWVGKSKWSLCVVFTGIDGGLDILGTNWAHRKAQNISRGCLLSWESAVWWPNWGLWPCTQHIPPSRSQATIMCTRPLLRFMTHTTSDKVLCQWWTVNGFVLKPARSSFYSIWGRRPNIKFSLQDNLAFKESTPEWLS